jgi:hypothetical protein
MFDASRRVVELFLWRWRVGMSVVVAPWIENLRKIRDTVTNRAFACTAKEIQVPMQWRTGIVDANGADGGIDTVHGRNYLKFRTITCTLVARYNPATDSFATVTAALEAVINPGNPLELTFVDDQNRTWYWHVRAQNYDKVHSMKWVGYCEFPIVFAAADPRQRAAIKPGTTLLDDGLFLDDGWNLDEDPDVFDLDTLHQGTNHTITNDGTAADLAPIVSFTGPITGGIYGTWYYADGTYIQWAYGGSVAAGETVTVDAEQLEVASTLTAVDAYHLFYPPGATRNTTAAKGSWGFVDIGTTTFQLAYTAAGAGSSCAIKWWPRK